MSIFQPSNVAPYLQSIDVTKKNLFQCQVNTNSKVVRYVYTINDMLGNLVYTNGADISNAPLYNQETLFFDIPDSTGMINGNNYMWSIRLYQELQDIFITYGQVKEGTGNTNIYIRDNMNVKSGMYIKIGNEKKAIIAVNIVEETVNLPDGKTKTVLNYVVTVDTPFSFTPTVGTDYSIYSDFLDSKPAFPIYARKTPIVLIDNIVVQITKREWEWLGSYYQEDGVPIRSYEWFLYLTDINDNDNIISETGKIYSADIKFTYNQYLTGNKYKIRLVTENENNVLNDTGKIPFSVFYEVPPFDFIPKASVNCEKNAINLEWAAPIEVVAEPTCVDTFIQNVPYNGGVSVSIPDGCSIGYEKVKETQLPIEIPDIFRAGWQIRFNKFFTGNIILIEADNGTYTVWVDDYYFKWNLNGIEGFFYWKESQIYDKWCLQLFPVALEDVDYRWYDDLNWDDSLYWTEGGGADLRIDKFWYKFALNTDNVRVQRGDN